MKIATKELSNMLDAVSVAAAMGGSLNGMGPDALLVVSAENNLRLCIDCGCCRATVDRECPSGDEALAVVISPRRLKLLLQPRAGAEYAEVELLPGKESLLFRRGDMEAKLPSLDSATFPADISYDPVATICGAGLEYGEKLSLACECVGDGAQQAYNTNVSIQDDGKDRLLIMSTDQKQMFFAECPSTGVAFLAVVPGKLLRSIAPMVQRSDFFTAMVGSSHVRFRISLANISYPASKGILSMLTDDHSESPGFLVNRELTLDAVRMAKAALSEGEYAIALSKGEKSLELRAESQSGATYHEAIPMLEEGAVIDRFLSADYLMKFLSALECETVRASTGNDDKTRSFKVVSPDKLGVSWYCAYTLKQAAK
jgi:hypothetical protein